MYTLQLKNNYPEIIWDPGLEILHTAAYVVSGHLYDAQLVSSDSITVIGVDRNKRGLFHLMDGDANSIIRKYRGVVDGTTYTLHVWDTLKRFNDLKQTLGK